MNVNVLRHHLAALCAQHRVVVLEDDRLELTQALAAPKDRVVVMVPIVDDVTYGIALHEMGHIVAPGGHSTEPVDREAVPGMEQLLGQEDAAWRWAIETALVWSAEMEAMHIWARETYRRKLVDIYRRVHKIDTPIGTRVRPGKHFTEWS